MLKLDTLKWSFCFLCDVGSTICAICEIGSSCNGMCGLKVERNEITDFYDAHAPHLPCKEFWERTHSLVARDYVFRNPTKEEVLKHIEHLKESPGWMFSSNYQRRFNLYCISCNIEPFFKDVKDE